jgi:hypothetical protein
MTKANFYRLLTALVAALLLSCGHDAPNNTGVSGLDTSVVGNWYGMMPPIPLMKFNGAKIFVDISKTDSVFSLVTFDTTRDTTKNPAIKDTSLILTGTWKLNAANDSILLKCDTGRIIDTTLNILSPRAVRGQIIPMVIDISKNPSTGDIEWSVPLTEMVPLAPFLGLDLSSIPVSILQLVTITLVKVQQ